ncbi:hypothetical protein [Providencia rettgeri]|uniref:hypothetical protein n=1 Tax=Providencia rettgeri TaxID=587 RepID=UPI0023611918|nr:hypothetical protein [Providencia rettgeri]
MTPNIFIEDFERTTNSDYLHGVLGRALIIATRFDSSCKALSEVKDVDTQAMIFFHKLDIKVESNLKEKLADFKKLSEAIKQLKLSDEIATILFKANSARNKIAHDVAKGLEGCIDSKVDDIFIENIGKLVGDITEGDIVVSALISNFNKDPKMNIEEILQYKDKVIDWVIKA